MDKEQEKKIRKDFKRVYVGQIETKCLHRWKEIEDYVSISRFLFFKTRVKIMECKKCGIQRALDFPLKKYCPYDE